MELIDDAPTALRFRILMQDEAWQPEMEKAIG